MADIISIDDRRRKIEEEQDDTDRHRKLSFVRTMIQEAKGLLRCEKCHKEINLSPEPEETAEAARIPYAFCAECAEEYIDYIERLHGRGKLDDYWRNPAWQRMWKQWTNYRGAVDDYIRSNEFRQLMDELKQPDFFE